MSGGVDSSVSAALLVESGFDVTGVFIKAWHPEWLPCNWKAERRDAMRVAAHLRIPFVTLDLEKEYKKEVVDTMISEYKKGRTPNPDVLCNKEIKFGKFLDFARKSGADFVATGHYAQREEYRMKNGELRYGLKKSKDTEKDQTYFLWTLRNEELKHILFPIGNLKKIEVRKLAKKYNLPTAEKKDSQGLCFVGKIDLKDFLSQFITAKPGNVLDMSGKIVGKHKGAIFYTIGQRHGFTIKNKNTESTSHYVVQKNAKKNTITVSANQKETAVALREVVLKDTTIVSPEQYLGQTMKALARYRQTPLDILITNKSPLTVVFNEPQADLAPGQSMVLYRGSECIGGGIIA